MITTGGFNNIPMITAFGGGGGEGEDAVASLGEIKEMEGGERRREKKRREEERSKDTLISIDNPKPGPTANNLNPDCCLHFLQFSHGFQIVSVCPGGAYSYPASKDRKQKDG